MINIKLKKQSKKKIYILNGLKNSWSNYSSNINIK